MGIYLPNMEVPKTPLLVCIYPNGICSDEEGMTYRAVSVPPHGRCVDADEFLKRAIGTKCFRGDYALMLEELVGESTNIIPAEEGET